MSNKDLMPPKNEDFDLFQGKFYPTVVQHLSGPPAPPLADWGIPQGAFYGLLSSPKSEWDPSWAIGRNKETRTPADTKRMQVAKKNYVAPLRIFIRQWIANNTILTAQDLISLGLKPRDKHPSPAPIPTTHPLLQVFTGEPFRHEVRFRDEGDPKKRAKPDHARFCEIKYQIGGTAPLTPEASPNTATPSRSPFRNIFSASDAGKRVYYFGRWANTRNQAGPWGTMVSAIIPG